MFISRHACIDEIVYMWSQHDLWLSILTNVEQCRTDLAGFQFRVSCFWSQSLPKKSATISTSIDGAISYTHSTFWLSMKICIGDIERCHSEFHAGSPADHQINCFQVCCWTVCSDSLCGFLITSFNKSTFELDLMFFTFSLEAWGANSCLYLLVYDLLVEVSGVLPPQLV